MKITIYNILSYISYILVIIGSYYGINAIEKNNTEEGLNKFIQIGIMPLLFIGFIRHTLLAGNIIKSHPFFEMEAGGANLGIFVGLLVGYLLNIGQHAISCILLIFLVYLSVAAITNLYYKGKSVLLRFVPILGIITYFVVKGLQ